MQHIPIRTVDELATADAIIFKPPTRVGTFSGTRGSSWMPLDGLWAKGALVGKVGSVFTSFATQHGGQESTILSFVITLLHHGLIIVGLPYSFQGQMGNDEIIRGSPYGASTIAGTQAERKPTENELAAARYQNQHAATITAKLTRYIEFGKGGRI